VASLISIRLGISVALVEIALGVIGGNFLDLHTTTWIDFLASFGAVLLTFLAGAEIDPDSLRRNLRASLAIGAVSFGGPFVAAFAFARFALGWPLGSAEVAGVALSTTSVAVVYAVMVETGLNQTEIGKIILAGCFVNDVGTVLALGIVFANYNVWLVLFGVATALAMWFTPKVMPWFTKRFGGRVSEPEAKLLLLILFGLATLAAIAKSEAVLPAYLLGMTLATFFIKERALAKRLRAITFTLLTPFYFLKSGSLVKFDTIMAAIGLITIFLAVKMATKFVGILPLTRLFNFGRREGMYTTLMMCTGLTFGTISALFGLTNHIIDREQYTILVTAVIASAVVPTLIAQRWFQPTFKPIAKEGVHVQENPDR
jgi:Kef-type K+ transport system membrane component KefB